MDGLTFVVEMSKAWAWPLTILVIGFVALRHFKSVPTPVPRPQPVASTAMRAADAV